MRKGEALERIGDEIRRCREHREELQAAGAGKASGPEGESWEWHQNEGYLSGLLFAEHLLEQVGKR